MDQLIRITCLPENLTYDMKMEKVLRLNQSQKKGVRRKYLTKVAYPFKG